MSDCPGLAAHNPTSSYRTHCPGCTENAQLRAQNARYCAALAPSWERDELDEARAERDQLRAQLAQRTAAIQEHLRLHDHHLNGEPDCQCVVCEILQPLRDALADPDAPKGGES
jgi:hypothetical protein